MQPSLSLNIELASAVEYCAVQNTDTYLISQKYVLLCPPALPVEEISQQKLSCIISNTAEHPQVDYLVFTSEISCITRCGNTIDCYLLSSPLSCYIKIYMLG